MAFEISGVPTDERFISEECRGYLYGLSIGILISEGIELSRDNLIDTLIGAFGLTYGDWAGRDPAFQTAQDVQADKPNVVGASDWAIEDVKGVYASGGASSTLGFYFAANGML